MKKNGNYYSLSTKVAISFSLLSSFIFSVSILALYFTLEYYIYHNNTNFLNNEINIIENIFKQHPDDASALKQEIIWEPGLSGSHYMARIFKSNGEVFLETPGMKKIMPAANINELLTQNHSLLRAPLKANHKYYRMMVKRLAINDKEEKFIVIQVAADITHEYHLLQFYKNYLLIMLAVGIILSSLLSYWMAQWLLKPLRQFIDKITTQSIDTLDKQIIIHPNSDEMHRLLTEFNGMLERIHREYQKIQRFSSDVAHELRTPLNNLLLIAEDYLATTSHQENSREIFHSIIDESNRLSKIIDQLLFITQADAMKVTLKKTTFPASEEIKKLIEYFGILAETNHIQLNVAGEATLVADRTLFSQALSNLLSNAIKYSPSGSVIEITIHSTKTGVHITVCDSGVGISATQLPYIFDRFYRVDESRNTSTGGYGLGLSIVKSIMDIHDGEIRVESELGKGSRFTLLFYY
ncbi:MAG TPA: heavy metal sensor histidine kinase [Coxiellaceae bacterium]|nr:heavy metal sensor histidine kinase [Coxiellaceae bacterium]